MFFFSLIDEGLQVPERLWDLCKVTGPDWHCSVTNGARVHLPDSRQSLSTDTGLWWRKVVFVAGPSKEDGRLVRPEPLMAFRQGFKSNGKVRVVGCVIGSRTCFWVAGGEVTGWCLGISGITLLVPTSLGSTCLWSAPSSGWGVFISAEQLEGTCQIVTYIPWGGTRSAETLFYCSAMV